jgi:hypothetical protein
MEIKNIEVNAYGNIFIDWKDDWEFGTVKLDLRNNLIYSEQMGIDFVKELMNKVIDNCEII